MVMIDIKSRRVLWVKGTLFLLMGFGAATLLWLELPTWRTALLLALCVWAFCRAYYFSFYVIEHYIDPGYRFAGLLSFIRYVMRKRTPD